MVEIKAKGKEEQVVITIETSFPEDYIASLRRELIKCLSGNEMRCGPNEFANLLHLLQEILPTLEQERKAHQ